MGTVLKNPQTGLYIREFMDEMIRHEMARAERHGRSFSIALIELDEFSKIQNRYGKKVGASVLAHLASRMELALRLSDSILGHWEEGTFLACLAECDLRGAKTAMERLRSRVAAEPVHVLVHQIPITTSIGIAARRPGMKPEALIQEAQHALKQAQAAGPNHIQYVSF